MKFYYIYMIKFSNSKFYIGKRISKVEPINDVMYWGSPVTFKYLWEDTELQKEKIILKICKDMLEMDYLERKFIKHAWQKYPDLNLNRHCSPGFHHEARVRGGKTSYSRRLGFHSIPIAERKGYDRTKYQKDFILKSPEGKIIRGNNVRKFCTENNLNRGSISLVLNGKRKSHKGWTLSM